MLSLPIPRASYYLGKLMGFSFLSMVAALVCGLFLLLYVPPDQVLLWSVSLTCELLIVTAFCLLCLFTLDQVTLALSAVIAFYVLSRGIAAFQLMASGPWAQGSSLADAIIARVIDGIALLLPRFHEFTASEWLVYHTGDWQALLPVLGQTAVYLVLLAGAALFDLYRKNL